MHKEILTKEQIELLPLIKLFKKNFGLVGGTAIALYIGHRESIDFDMFSFKEFENTAIRKKIFKTIKTEKVLVNKKGEYTILIKGVKITFYNYLFEINFSENFNNIIKLPDLLTLAAMKAYALGQRAKWKDYVDLYFIIKDYFSIKEISKKANEIFKNEFNEKLFRSQLAYFKDINYSEEVIFKKDFEISNEKIKKELIKFSLS
ncbi:nucleotidyl transferase AbiEii/AbiGii toxin family protein [Candidatus Wolfebacteria bacterium]|nr:nucleotidyl transferase AbiEii/AbiGii toxin family protein [Candidatus Wolfebacteria bacterium]